jgi:hypothetical protein
MKVDDALRKIDNMTNILAVDIPEEIMVFDEVYHPKEDINSGNSQASLQKYQELYYRVREKIKSMEDVPEEIVHTAIVLRRIVLFLKEYHHTDEIDDKKKMDGIYKENNLIYFFHFGAGPLFLPFLPRNSRMKSTITRINKPQLR